MGTLRSVFDETCTSSTLSLSLLYYELLVLAILYVTVFSSCKLLTRQSDSVLQVGMHTVQ